MANPNNLTDIEQRLLVVALIGVGMRQGEDTYPAIDRVAKKLGIEEMMKVALVSFVAFGQALEREIRASHNAENN